MVKQLLTQQHAMPAGTHGPAGGGDGGGGGGSSGGGGDIACFRPRVRSLGPNGLAAVLASTTPLGSTPLVATPRAPSAAPEAPGEACAATEAHSPSMTCSRRMFWNGEQLHKPAARPAAFAGCASPQLARCSPPTPAAAPSAGGGGSPSLGADPLGVAGQLSRVELQLHALEARMDRYAEEAAIDRRELNAALEALARRLPRTDVRVVEFDEPRAQQSRSPRARRSPPGEPVASAEVAAPATSIPFTTAWQAESD